MFFKKKEKKKDIITDNIEKIDKSIFSSDSLLRRLSPGGVEPSALNHCILNDAGRDIYYRSFYIEKLPRITEFVTTFEKLYSFPNTTVNMFIEPMPEGKAQKHIDRQVIELESEHRAAIKAEEPNSIRKNRNKLSKAEEWAERIETGNNRLFLVGFLYTIHEESLEKLDLISGNLIAKARETGIELVSCYGSEPEAFLSAGPYNKLFTNKFYFINTPTIKKHPMDDRSLAAIYSHTTSHFSHAKGIPLGRNIRTGRPIIYDVYDPSHNGYGVVYTGKTGTGKSATIKISGGRMIPQGYRFGIIDSDKKGNRGEYFGFTEKEGGKSYQISTDSKNILNIYEIDVHDEYDELTETEFKSLRVLETITNVVNILMTMIVGVKNEPDFKDAVYINRILTDIVTKQYEDKGIIEGIPESLYEEGGSFVGDKITSGMKKKQLPTIAEFILYLCKFQKTDEDEYHRQAYSFIYDVIKDYVREIYFNKDTFKVYTKEEYMESYISDSNVIAIKGTKGYYDGQSTVSIASNISVATIDISGLPKSDIPIAQEIALHFLEEHMIKRNSENPKKANKMVIIVDEAHKMFPYPDARRRLADFYRTSRKRNVSVWTCTQSYADFKGFEETEAIIANATSKFLFKQDRMHREYLLSSTVLTESEVDMLISLGGDLTDENHNRKGEVCLIDNDRVVFLKVDYLIRTEGLIVETDMNKLKQMYGV